MKKKFEHSVIIPTRVLNFNTFISGIKPFYWGTYGSCIKYFQKKSGVVVMPNVNDLCFVHGNIDELYDGKKCVVRDCVVCYENTGMKNELGYEVWNIRYVDRAVIHMPNGSVILAIGKTQNGNTVIVMK